LPEGLRGREVSSVKNSRQSGIERIPFPGEDVVSFLLSYIGETDDIVTVKDKDLVILYLNRAGAAFLGVSPEEGKGRRCFEVLGRKKPCVGCLSGPAAETGRFQFREVFIPERNTWFEVKSWPVRNADGETAAVVEVLRDCSERKKAEEELAGAVTRLEAKNRELEEERKRAEGLAEEAGRAERVKSAFLANMSHEIRTPLNGILGMTDLLLDSPMAKEQEECAETIQRSAEHLLSLVDEILDLSKLEAGKLVLESVPFDLREMVEDLVTETAVRGAEKGLDTVLSLDPSVPSVLRGDPVRTRQILGNLLGNAVKFTLSGEVRLDVSSVDSGLTGFVLRFSVSDTGIGVPENAAGALFQPFFQGDPSTTRRFGGTGLGLSICRGLAEAMGGSLGMTPRSGGGSVFWCELPFGRVPFGEAEDLPVDQRLLGFPVILAGGGASWQTEASGLAGKWLCSVRTADSPEDLRSLLEKRSGGDGDGRCAVFVDRELLRKEAGWSPSALPADLRRGVLFFSVDPPGTFPETGYLLREGLAGRITSPLRRGVFREAVLSAAETDRGKRQGSPGGSEPAGSFRSALLPARVLIADDSRVNRKVAARMLQKLGCSVTGAADGEEALRMLQTERFDIVLMDVQMPGKDGLEVTSALRSPEWTGCNGSVPVIAMTAHALPGDREKCLAAGMDDYLPKPVRFRDLEEKLSVHLSRRRPEEIDAPAEGTGGVYCREEAVLRLNIDGEELDALAGEYLEDALEILDRMADAEERGDEKAAADAAHTLKGMSANIGAERVRAAALRAERSWREGGNGASMADVLRAELRNFGNVLGGVRERRDRREDR